MPKIPTKKRKSFFARLPGATFAEINRRVTLKKKQWHVIVDAINATKPRKSK